ncbi:choice-of-anchor L domain-containing protein [Sorangium sp. So ce1128]
MLTSATLLTAGGCAFEDASGDGETGEVRQALLPGEAMPPRPVIGPGESNWAPAEPSISASEAPADIGAEQACPSLSTTDLNTLSPSDLVNTLLGSGAGAPVVSNVSFTGANIAAGTFTGGTEPIGFESGVILSSGNIASVVGPNAQDNVTTNNDLPGDADLDGLIPGFSTLDATVLEFDFECPGTEALTFQYVFTSDEYNEFVNSSFNDVFGFFVNGTNVALIPGTATPVAINNVNCGNPYDPLAGGHCDKFINNDLSDGGGAVCTEMDGLTVVFTAEAPVNPGVNHIRLAIGDAGDQNLDSNIFLKGGSFTCNRPPVAKCKDVIVPADAVCSANASIDGGSSDPDGDEITCVQTPAGPYPLGATGVTLTCTDPSGASDSCTGTVTVVDVTPPDIECPADQTAECVNGGATVDHGNATASDNCGEASVACVPPSGSIFDLGDTAVDCTASDASGNDSTCQFNVAVVDTTPPTVSVGGAGELWPPNHRYVTVSLDQCGIEINDQCQGVLDLENADPTITCVTSDEVEDGFGDSNTTDDMIIDATSVRLRAERSDDQDGRVYKIQFEVSDEAGNATTAVCKVTVPADQGPGGDAIDSGVHFTVGTCN